jgi:amino acid adenylation domain-containing protein
MQNNTPSLRRAGEKTPNNIAVVFEDKKLTYKELNEKANRLAKTLRERGVKPDDIVAIMAERSLDMIVGIMAILKAGGAYLPIDPEYPEDRIKYIFEDSKADIILTQNKFMEKVLLDGQKIRLEDESAYADEGDNLEIINTSKDLAYVIYTSGSTGLPKGVMIEHHSVINRINWMQKSYPISEADIIMQKTTYTFDVSVWELFWWSFAGASVCLLPPKGERDPEVILNCIEKNKITTMHFVPSMFNGFMLYVYVKEEKNRLSGLRQIFCCGEALTKKQVEMFGSLTENIRLINLYGPTEATVDVSYYECLKEESSNSIPIGKPIDNISLYIIGSNNQLQPIGVAGELCISGVGLARGYLNKAELTKEKFIENPFIKGERMYKTGDLARWLTDGNIEYLGRIDHQVKIRGFRIELGEIEAVLKKHPAVKETVVVARNIKGDLNVSRLIAYLTLEGEEKPSDELLQGFLRSKLPDYMVPSYFITLENIPLTSNGKVNTKALPEPNNELLNIEEHYVAPSTSIEKTLAEIWTKVLNVNKIGIHDNFFNLGGDSILSILVVSQAKEKGLSLSVQQVFLHPTIAELAKELDLSKPEPAPKEKAQAFSLLSEKDRAKLFKLNNQDDPLHKRSE